MESKTPLDIYSLSSVLRVNSIDIKTLRENEQRTNYYKTLPNYSPLLLSIACNFNKEFPEEICLNAAIQLKNYISSYWKNTINNNNINNDPEDIIINDEDKNNLRIRILDAVIYVIEIENFKILKQFNQCVKKILKNDCKDKKIDYIKVFINKVITCLNSKNLKQTYAGIILFYQLSKIFEFDNEENQKIYNEELVKVNNYLLSSLYECKDINNSTQAQFAYKIIKIFFKSFQGAIPELFTQEKIFDQWISFIINIIKIPINQNNVNSNNNRTNIFFKLKRVCYQTITRIIQKSSKYNSNDKNPFDIMINNKYISIFFELYKTIFMKCFNNKLFIDDYGKTCIYNFFSILMENNKYSKMVLDIFINDKNNEFLNYIINDCYMTYDDLELWNNDPKKYLAEKLEEINSILTRRYNSCKLFSSLFTYRESKKNKPLYYKILYDFLFNSLINENNQLNIEKQKLLNNNTPYYLIYNDINYCLRKESILYLLKYNKSTILKYLKKDFENFIEKIIVPEFNSPCAFLREQACSFIKTFKSYKYTNDKLVENLAKCFSYLMQNDPILPVRFESSMALSSILDQKNVKELIRGNIQILLQIYLKLMEETELEEIMDSLQDVVKNFTEESKVYIVELSEYLIKYFNKLVKHIQDEDKEDEVDDFSLINNIINTFSNFAHYFINNENIYSKIENHIDILLNYCIIVEPFDKLEDGINLLEEILNNCKIAPKHIHKFFIPLIKTILEKEDETINNNIINDNIDLNGFGYESIMDINKIICYYLYKDDGSLIDSIDTNGQKYIYYIIKYIKEIIKVCDKNKEFRDYIYIFDICNTLFDKYKNKVEIIVEEILNDISSKFVNNKNETLSNYLCFLLSICFLYYPTKTLKYFQNNNKLRDIFMFWFLEIDKIKSYKQLKYNLFGICSLISLDQNQQDKLIFDNIKLFVDKILKLIEKINEKIKKEEKENEKEKEKEKNKEEENENDDDLNEDDLFQKFLEGKEINDDEDEDWEEDEEDDEINFTQADKQIPILIVKYTFDLINQKFPELFKNILNILGDNVNKLKNIFINEELRLKNKS